MDGYAFICNNKELINKRLKLIDKVYAEESVLTL
jgi:molybdopterin molybdotransferase